MHGKPHPLNFFVKEGPIDSHNHPYWVVNENINLGELSRFEKLFVCAASHCLHRLSGHAYSSLHYQLLGL